MCIRDRFSAGLKPNFIIAMYCLAILLIRPKVYEALLIGIIAGAVCQFFPGTPYVNLISEPIGAVVMALDVYKRQALHCAYDRFQFIRLGYFCIDSKRTEKTADGMPVFNRIVPLKSSFKIKG